MEDRAESEKKIKNGAPRVPEEGFGGLPGSPWDGLGRPKGGPEPYFYNEKPMIFKRVTKMMFPKRKNMTKRSGRS